MWNLKAEILFVILLIAANKTFTQISWTWTPKADMPFKISNNALSEDEMSGNKLQTYEFKKDAKMN